jgi:TonB-linked SusC/RagA family outer membrane protein
MTLANRLDGVRWGRVHVVASSSLSTGGPIMRSHIARVLVAGVAGLLATSIISAQQPVTISGRVTSEAGIPLAATSVFIDALKLGTQTREDGRYSLVVPAGRATGSVVLSARRIGHKLATATVPLTGAAVTQDFTLTQSALQLTGVVVSALSMNREKATISTSQQQISSEDLSRTRDANIVNTLSGKVSGIQISGSGNIGGSARVVIRGSGSILGENQPLFIVDGIPISNRADGTTAGGGRDFGNAVSDLNPDDIETVTVLKGPNAAALYGSRAANGAIVITTKNGRGANGVKVTLNSYATSDRFSVLPTYQNRYGQGFGGEFKFVDGAGGGVNDGADESWGPMLDGRLIDQFTGKQQPWVPHPDNVKDYFEAAHTLSSNLSIVADGGRASSRLSLTRENISGIVPNSAINKTVGSLSGNMQVGSKLSTFGAVQYIQHEGLNRPEIGYTEGNPFQGFTWFGRQVDTRVLRNKFRDENGELFNWNYNYHRNPFWQQAENPERDRRDRVIATASANYEFAPWLRGLVRTGVDWYRVNVDENFADGNIDRVTSGYKGALAFRNDRESEANTDAILTATRNLGMFEVTANVGGNIRRKNFHRLVHTTSGLLVPGIYNLSNAGIVPTVTNFDQRSGVNSTYGSAIVTMNRYWTVEVTGRNDWSSTLPKDNSSYFYPSVSSSLILSDLFPGLQNSWINFAKLRGGWAQVGLDADPYLLETTYSGVSQKFGSLPQFTLNNTTANANLKPERTTGAEGGLELSLFGDRLSVDATYYVKKSRDQIINLPVAPATGFAFASINAGQLSNRGIELQLTARPVRLRNGFEWTSTVNWSRNRSQVDELTAGLTNVRIGSNWGAEIQARLGEPYGVIVGKAWLRDSTTGQLLLTDGLPQPDPVLKVLGNVNPDWVGGWLNDFRYKNFSITVLVDMRQGGKNFSSGNWFGNYSGVLESSLRGREVDWDKPGIVVQGIDAATGQPNTTRVTSEDYFHNWFYAHEDAVISTSYMKLRELRVGWMAPSSVASRLRLSQLGLSFVGRNLWTKTDFPNYDPENAYNTGNAGQGFDFGALPTARSIGIHLTLTP